MKGTFRTAVALTLGYLVNDRYLALYLLSQKKKKYSITVCGIFFTKSRSMYYKYIKSIKLMLPSFSFTFRDKYVLTFVIFVFCCLLH